MKEFKVKARIIQQAIGKCYGMTYEEACDNAELMNTDNLEVISEEIEIDEVKE